MRMYDNTVGVWLESNNKLVTDSWKDNPARFTDKAPTKRAKKELEKEAGLEKDVMANV